MNTSSEPNVGVGFIAPPQPLTLIQRIRHRLFPKRYCDQPKKAGYVWPEMITIRTRVKLNWKDRIRVMFTGSLLVTTLTACEHVCGNTETCSSVEVQPPVWME